MVQLAENECAILVCVCSIHWSVERDINGQRIRDNTDALDETRKRAHTTHLSHSASAQHVNSVKMQSTGNS